jgi:hypothetical protein
VARSAELTVLAGLAAAIVLLTGCVTTQQRNARAKLSAERYIAARAPLRIGALNPDVDVVRTALVRTRARTAVIVELRSRARRPLADLPIAVGVRTPGGRRLALNGAADLTWFRTHVAALPSGALTRWVFVTGRRVPAGSRAEAQVGRPGTPAGHPSTLPRLEADALSDGRVVVRNVSDIPQTDVPVYAVAQAGDRYVAAGVAATPKVSGHTRTMFALPLVGTPGAARIHVDALPTIFK